MNRKAFAHLFKMPVPMMEHFDHYMDRLRMTGAYYHISRQWMEWQAWEATLSDQDGGRAASEWRSRLVETLQALKVEYLLTLGLPKRIEIPKIDNRTIHHGEILISLDLVQANWTAIRTAGPALEAFSWEEWTAEQGLPPILRQSKVLRQQVLGCVNPKAQQQRQALATSALAEQLRAQGFEIVAHSADEVVIKDPGADLWESLTSQVLSPAGDNFAWGEVPERWPVRVERYQLCPLPRRGFVKRRPALPAFRDYQAAQMQGAKPRALPGCHASLFGVPGARFYFELCRTLLEIPCQPEDLQFMNEGHIAQWVEK